jgi:hypothetical protein
MNVETDITSSSAVSPKGETMILVIMYFRTFKTDVIVFISNIIMCLTSH